MNTNKSPRTGLSIGKIAARLGAGEAAGSAVDRPGRREGTRGVLATDLATTATRSMQMRNRIAALADRIEDSQPEIAAELRAIAALGATRGPSGERH